MKTKYLQLDDIKIAYSEHGSGKNLLLLHGNSENKGIFREHQLKHFKHFHTYALDSRGHGQSISCDSEYSINQFSDDVVNFCKKLGISKAYVVGFSDGGNICLFLAKKHPEIFERIVALSPNYLVSGTTDEALRQLNRMYKIFLLLKKLRLPVKKHIMRWKLMLNDIGITDDELKSIRANICILYAENDMIKEDHMLKISQLISGCKVKKISGCNHFNIYKKEKTVKEIFATFAATTACSADF
ncbi:MAG: alpha/beta hydrolase [Prevotellaceae bacterium]|jgi:pimeloyl-ACP methyl ester carboxylesterase|nr:alpha/beta hydrolase [Prevotellaceae bacterium]